MNKWLVVVVGAGALALAACTGASNGAGSSSQAPSSSAAVESASSGGVAGEGTDNRSRCSWSWNPDTTANVQLLNKVQRVGITSTWQSDDSKDGAAMRLKQDSKQWTAGGGSGLGDEGEWSCKSVPWTISNDNSRVYDWDGNEWTGDGDNDFYWGHTQDISGAAQEPNGWVKFICTGAGSSGGNTAQCPESALKSSVKVTWDAENDNWTTLERQSPCEFSANTAIGCYEVGTYGGQYEGQFNFNAVAWSAPMRVTVTTGAKDDQGNAIVWKVDRADRDGVLWPNGTGPEGTYVKPGDGVVFGGYATATNGRHAITLTLRPAYSVDGEGNPLECTSTTVGTGKKIVCTKSTVEKAILTPPILEKRITATVVASMNLSGVSTTSGPPTATLDTKDQCLVVPSASKNSFSIDCKQVGGTFTYGGAWSANIKTT